MMTIRDTISDNTGTHFAEINTSYQSHIFTSPNVMYYIKVKLCTGMRVVADVHSSDDTIPSLFRHVIDDVVYGFLAEERGGIL